MRPDVFVFGYPYLDLLPRRDSVAPTLKPVWSRSLPQMKSVALRRFGTDVLIEERLPGRSIVRVGEPTADWTSLGIEVSSLCPSAVGSLCLSDRSGRTYLWETNALPVSVWQPATPAGEYAVTAIGGTRLLVQCYDSNGVPRIEAVDASSAQPLWRLATNPLFLAALPCGLLFLDRDAPVLECLDPLTGDTRWKSAWPGGVRRLAYVGDVLWAPGQHELIRLDCSSGRLLPSVPAPRTATPGGILDPGGIFHCCLGPSYQTFDLRDDGRASAVAEFRITTEGPTLGAGPTNTLVTTDDRLIFADQRNGVWVVPPDRRGEPQLLWRAAGPVTGIAALRNELLVVEKAGVVTALGEP